MNTAPQSPLVSGQAATGSTPKPAPTSSTAVKRVLVPTDFSEPANHALSFALNFAQQNRGEITLLHVVEVVIAPEFAAYAALTDEDDLKRRMRDRLQAIASAHHAESVLKDILVRRGTPYHEICKVAEEMHADMIVIGTHGYTGVKHMMLGSTAERVVRYAACPVVVVPSRQRTA